MRRLHLRLLTALLLLTVGACAPGGGDGGTGGLSDYFSAEVRDIDKRIAEARKQLSPLPELFLNQQTGRIGYVSRPTDANAPRNPDKPDTRSIRLDLGNRQPIDNVVLVPADFSTGQESGAGYGFPVRWRVEVSDDPGFEEMRILADHTGQDFPNPRRYPVVIPAEGVATRYIRLTATALWTSEGRSLLALGEIMVLQGDRNVAAGLPRRQIVSGGDDSDEDPPTWSRSNLVDGQSVIGSPQGIEDSPADGWQSLEEKNADTSSWVVVDLGREIPVNEIRLIPAISGEYPTRRGLGFPLSLKVDAAHGDDPTFAQTVGVDDWTGFAIPNPRENPVSFRVPGTPLRYIRVTATRRSERLDDYVFALSELQVFSGGENVALGASVSAQNSLESDRWSTRFLTDGFTSQRNILPWQEYVTGLQKRRELGREIGGLNSARTQAAERVMHTALKWSAWGLGIAALAILYSVSRGRRARRRDLAQLRRRLAQDIHDEIGSGLGTISLLSQMGSGYPDRPEETREEFAEINRLTRTVTEALRDIVWFIRPDTKTVEALAQRLKETTSSMLAGIENEFRAEGPALERELPLEHKRQVLLFFKEALHNVVKHSGATRACAAISGDEKHFRLTIHDNGCGFDHSAPASGAGVTGMKQRALTLGGKLHIVSSAGAGTTLTLEVPWRAPRKSAARPSGT